MSDLEPVPIPFSREAEEALLGSILIDPGVFLLIDLVPSAFYIRRHGWVWEALGALNKRGVSVDFVTLVEELERMGKLKELGGPAYLASLANVTPTSLHAEEYAGIIRDKARRREMLEVSRNLAKAALSDQADIDEAGLMAVKVLGQNSGGKGAARLLSNFVDDLYADVCTRMENPRTIFGIETGISDYDQATGGMQPGEVLYVGGEPGIGKSILSIQMGIGMAERGHPGVIYSLEMRGLQVSRRIVSALGQVETAHLKSGHVTESEFVQFTKAAAVARALPVFMSDEAYWTTAGVRADLARLKAQHRIEWFVLDYLYLLSDGLGKDSTERTELLSSRIKLICREFDLAGLTVNSVTKDGADIRGSGQVKHDADVIGMLLDHQPDTSRAEIKKPNMRTFVFKKGREMAMPKSYFHLVKCDTFPAFRNYAPEEIAAGKNGRNREQYWDR